jgi:hypothetical protein
MKEQVSGHKDTQSGEQRFPRLKCHEQAEYEEHGVTSSHEKRNGSKGLE